MRYFQFLADRDCLYGEAVMISACPTRHFTAEELRAFLGVTMNSLKLDVIVDIEANGFSVAVAVSCPSASGVC